ncbi:SsgA family sporulation/cell division regulator [Streptomyces humi]|uniref:SsgA family sporulation/cell division regulator n=1 Tax=Streptomyces humi TaxID=1428620 RepID=UPI0006289202|nr:SsgA family sporulation/cell division regulator [Streptomyces humi]
MRKPVRSVVYGTTAQVNVRGEPQVSLPAELRYRTADPYAVCLSLGAPLTGPVDWLFARSLLAAGLRLPAGTGDVRVIPRHRGHPDRVGVVLRVRAQEAAVDIETSVVSAFLMRTLALVPEGTEGLHVDLDRAVAELLEDAE